MKLVSVGPVISEKIFENTHTHTFLHTRTQQLRVVPDEMGGGAGGRGGGFEGKALLYFCGRWRGCFFFFFFFFQSSGQ